MLSNCQYCPRCENGSSAVHALTITLEAFVEPRVGLLHRHAEPGELVVAVALADAEIEPAAGQEIEGRGLLGQQHRVVPRQHDDRRAEAQRRVRAPSQVNRLIVAETWP